ncbi:DsbC family protein [Burkholderia cepacia]|uniref:DsbC family protein n=1 Tax=Burkholderia cepacia TaxID=292 RepID=UPI0029906CC2|nr:DsbC family protein [Burkholderia cepacia]
MSKTSKVGRCDQTSSGLPINLGLYLRWWHPILNMPQAPMKQVRFTFALLVTTCLAWGCAAEHSAAVTASPIATSDVPAVAPAELATSGNRVAPNVDPGVAALKASLHARYPSTQFREVAATPSTGIYEVVMGNKVAYTDITGRYFLFGHLFDMVTQQDLTVPLEQALQKVRFPADRLQDAFVEVHGTGRRKLAIFDDPDCPYCLTLEDDLSQLKDVTIYRFLYPLESLHPRARAHSIAIWCAEDRLATWHAWMPLALSRWMRDQGSSLVGGAAKTPAPPRVEPKLVSCANPIDTNEALAASLGIAGTPALVSEDGRVMPGAASAEAIDQWLGAK